MVSDAKKKRAALKAVGRKGSSKSLNSEGGESETGGSVFNLDKLVAEVGAASIDDGGDRSVTSVLTSHPQVRGERSRRRGN